MGLETGSFIADLDDTWPLSGDLTSRGDDHLRLIKAILKAQFPGAGGDGFSEVILATEDEINYLSGVTSNIQDQLDAIDAVTDALAINLKAPVGTRMPFAQVSAPTGWTLDASVNNYMMRVVNAAGGSVGGSDSPISWSAAHTHTTGDFTLTTTHIPPHTHFPAGTYNRLGGGQGPDWASGDSDGVNVTESSVGGGAPHNHGATGTGGPTFSPRYMNIIIGVKD